MNNFLTLMLVLLPCAIAHAQVSVKPLITTRQAPPSALRSTAPTAPKEVQDPLYVRPPNPPPLPSLKRMNLAGVTNLIFIYTELEKKEKQRCNGLRELRRIELEAEVESRRTPNEMQHSLDYIQPLYRERLAKLKLKLREFAVPDSKPKRR